MGQGQSKSPKEQNRSYSSASSFSNRFSRLFSSTTVESSIPVNPSATEFKQEEEYGSPSEPRASNSSYFLGKVLISPRRPLRARKIQPCVSALETTENDDKPVIRVQRKRKAEAEINVESKKSCRIWKSFEVEEQELELGEEAIPSSGQHIKPNNSSDLLPNDSEDIVELLLENEDCESLAAPYSPSQQMKTMSVMDISFSAPTPSPSSKKGNLAVNIVEEPLVDEPSFLDQTVLKIKEFFSPSKSVSSDEGIINHEVNTADCLNNSYETVKSNQSALENLSPSAEECIPEKCVAEEDLHMNDLLPRAHTTDSATITKPMMSELKIIESKDGKQMSDDEDGKEDKNGSVNVGETEKNDDHDSRQRLADFDEYYHYTPALSTLTPAISKLAWPFSTIMTNSSSTNSSSTIQLLKALPFFNNSQVQESTAVEGDDESTKCSDAKNNLETTTEDVSNLENTRKDDALNSVAVDYPNEDNTSVTQTPTNSSDYDNNCSCPTKESIDRTVSKESTLNVAESRIGSEDKDNTALITNDEVANKEENTLNSEKSTNNLEDCEIFTHKRSKRNHAQVENSVEIVNGNYSGQFANSKKQKLVETNFEGFSDNGRFAIEDVSKSLEISKVQSRELQSRKLPASNMQTGHSKIPALVSDEATEFIKSSRVIIVVRPFKNNKNPTLLKALMERYPDGIHITVASVDSKRGSLTSKLKRQVERAVKNNRTPVLVEWSDGVSLSKLLKTAHKANYNSIVLQEFLYLEYKMKDLAIMWTPFCHAWFLCVEDSIQMQRLARALFLRTLSLPDCLHDLQIRTGQYHASASELLSFYVPNNSVGGPEILHCTVIEDSYKHRDESLSDNVVRKNGQISPLTVVGFVLTPRTIGARVKVNDDQLAVFYSADKTDVPEDIAKLMEEQKNISSEGKLLAQSDLSVSSINVATSLSLHLEDETNDKVTLKIVTVENKDDFCRTSGKYSKAHMTLGCFTEKIHPRTTGFDLLDAIDREQKINWGEVGEKLSSRAPNVLKEFASNDNKFMHARIEDASVCCFGDGVWVIYPDEDYVIPSLFSGFFNEECEDKNIFHSC